MSADELRRAAALMRERARDARDAWGEGEWTAGETGYNDRQGLTYDVHAAMGAGLVATAGCEELAEHIASWHPAVALAVADWLELEADCTVPDDYDEATDAGRQYALRVARAYLNEAER